MATKVFDWQKSTHPEGAKQLWGPFYTSPTPPAPWTLDPSLIFDPNFLRDPQSMIVGRDTVTGQDLTGHQQTARGLADGIYNLPKTVLDTMVGHAGPAAAARELGLTAGDWVSGQVAPIVKPVVDNTVSWWTQPASKHKAKKAAASAPPPPKPAFSPMGGSGAASFIVANESSGNPNAQNPRSSAGGLHQFIDSTWLEVVKKHGASSGDPQLQQMATKIQVDKSGRHYVADPAWRNIILSAKTNPTASTLMADAHMAKDIVPQMTRALGRTPTQQEAYYGWFSGANKGALVASMPDTTRAGSIYGADAIRSNPQIFPQGAATPIATVKARLKLKGTASGDSPASNILAQASVQLPGPPPSAKAPAPQDFTRAEEILASLRPEGFDAKRAKSQADKLWLAGLMGGVESNEGGIPGMLARMASGGFKADALADDRNWTMEQQAKEMERAWKAKGLDLELTKSGTRAAESALAAQLSHSNASDVWKYDLEKAKLGMPDLTPSAWGTVTIPTVGQDGKVTYSVMDIGAETTRGRALAADVANSAFGGANFANIPPEKKTTWQQYLFAKQRQAQGVPGADAQYWGVFAQEIVESPHKAQLLGGSGNELQAEVAKAVARGGNAKDAEIGVVASMLMRKAQSNPEAMIPFMQQALGYGLEGPRFLAQ